MDISNWQEFRLGDIFSQERGREKAPKQNNPGDTILVNEISDNNGVTRLVEPTKIFKKNAITISINFARNVFYQEQPFCASVNIAIIRNANLNLYNGLFITAILRKIYLKYSYGYKITKEKINNTLLKLPARDNKPDWEYMTNYIKTIYHSMSGKILPKSPSSKQIPLVPGEWQEYRMDGLFTFVKGKRLTKEDMIQGDVNYLGAISENNGVREKIESEYVWQPNCITVNYNGSVGEAFYQSEPFWASDDVNVLYAKDFWEMNKYIAMFLITVIKANKYRFGYGRKWTMDKMKETVIRLPGREDGKPDFAYMEEYIRSLPYSDRI